VLEAVKTKNVTCQSKSAFRNLQNLTHNSIHNPTFNRKRITVTVPEDGVGQSDAKLGRYESAVRQDDLVVVRRLCEHRPSVQSVD